MRFHRCTILFSLLTLAAYAADHNMSSESTSAPKFTGMGNAHHTVTTSNPEAQAFFDQGMALVFGFNHDEAARSFKRAAELDPKLAMAYWGIALTQGANYNLPSFPEREKAAAEAMKQAVALAPGASESEQDYIQALAHRYSNDPKADLKSLAIDYRDAMRALMQKYPDDLDAATLFAESAMNLRPWQLWSVDQKPAVGTMEIVATLESVLKRNPNHLGANHYYIHAVEAGPFPEHALASAQRLAALAPASGHLVHMPAHIYIRTGDHDAAAKSNIAAAAADRAYFKQAGVQGIYMAMYYSHNLHFLANAYSMEGRFADAMAAAAQLDAHVSPMLKDMPMLDVFMPTTPFMMVRFHKWDDILKHAEPGPEPTLQNSMWRYARGMAFAAQGKTDNAAKERSLLADAAQKVPPDQMANRNTAKAVMELALNVLDARIAQARKDYTAEEKFLNAAVTQQDKLNYIEPPEWYYPVRESLGCLYLMTNRAADAEQTFRADLDRNPRNGRSLLGLMESLIAQKKMHDAEMVQEAFDSAWKNADTKITADEL